jgi:hypothetical protein
MDFLQLVRKGSARGIQPRCHPLRFAIEPHDRTCRAISREPLHLSPSGAESMCCTTAPMPRSISTLSAIRAAIRTAPRRPPMSKSEAEQESQPRPQAKDSEKSGEELTRSPRSNQSDLCQKKKKKVRLLTITRLGRSKGRGRGVQKRAGM